jgi:hypothetical protein
MTVGEPAFIPDNGKDNGEKKPYLPLLSSYTEILMKCFHNIIVI